MDQTDGPSRNKTVFQRHSLVLRASYFWGALIKQCTHIRTATLGTI